MKKNKFDGKLKLNKETVTKLNDEQMAQINGGDTNTTNPTANTRNSCYCGCPTTDPTNTLAGCTGATAICTTN